MPTPRRFTTLQRAGDHAHVTARTIRNWISKGYLTGYRFGPRAIRVDLDEVDKMLRVMPTTKVRTGRTVYGPDAKIVDLSNVVLREDEHGDRVTG